MKRRWSADKRTVAPVPDLEQLDELLKRFGTSLHSYRGEGRLGLRSGNALDVKFVVAQLLDGTNVILIRTAIVAPLFSAMSPDGILRFEGRTSDGLHVETRGKLGPWSFPGDMPREWGSGSWVSYTAQKLRVRMRSGTPGTVRYGLTNVRPPWRRELPLCLRYGDTAIKARLLCVPESKLIFERARILRSTAVTCELEMPVNGHLTTRQIQGIASDVCYLLSVAQGCKVEWIYREWYDEEDLTCREHWMRTTRPFSGLQVVPFDSPTAIRDYLEMTYPTYILRRDAWGLRRGPIDQYLEGKAEDDFLETRAAKLAVALEALKHWYLRREDTSISGSILKPREFKKLLTTLVSVTSPVLPDRYFEAVDEKDLRGKLLALNRESFARILERLSKDLGLELTSDERRRFIASRNALVHRGQFPRPKKGAEEYFFMVNILDRIFLKLIGFSGSYVDYRKLGAAEIMHLE